MIKIIHRHHACAILLDVFYVANTNYAKEDARVLVAIPVGVLKSTISVDSRQFVGLKYYLVQNVKERLFSHKKIIKGTCCYYICLFTFGYFCGRQLLRKPND